MSLRYGDAVVTLLISPNYHSHVTLSLSLSLRVCAGRRRRGGEVVSLGPRSAPVTQLPGVRERRQHGESLLLSPGLHTPLLSPPAQEEPQDGEAAEVVMGAVGELLLAVAEAEVAPAREVHLTLAVVLRI